MGEFMPEPSKILKGKEELLAEMNLPRPKSSDDNGWLIKSEFICDCIREIRASGQYPYNSTVGEYVREKLGLPYVRYEEGTKFSQLVYNAQQFTHSDNLRASGYSPLTQEMIDEAYKQKAKIETASGRVYNVRKIGDKCYAMKPHARNRALIVDCDTPAKIVKDK